MQWIYSVTDATRTIRLLKNLIMWEVGYWSFRVLVIIPTRVTDKFTFSFSELMSSFFFGVWTCLNLGEIKYSLPVSCKHLQVHNAVPYIVFVYITIHIALLIYTLVFIIILFVYLHNSGLQLSELIQLEFLFHKHKFGILFWRFLCLNADIFNIFCPCHGNVQIKVCTSC